MTGTSAAALAMRAQAQPVGEGFGLYVWSPTVAEVAARHGLRPETVLKFDQNTPPLPEVPQVPLAESMARLNEYPEAAYRGLRAAAASYAELAPENVVVGAGADELILLLAHTFLGPGSWRRSVRRRTRCTGSRPRSAPRPSRVRMTLPTSTGAAIPTTPPARSWSPRSWSSWRVARQTR